MSKNGIALVVLLVEGLLSAVGIEFEPGSVARVVEGVLVIVAFITMIHHQMVEREETKALIFKR